VILYDTVQACRLGAISRLHGDEADVVVEFPVLGMDFDFVEESFEEGFGFDGSSIRGFQEIQESVEQLAVDIQEFRNGAASEVSKISQAAGEVNRHLEDASQMLSDVDSELDDLRNRADEWKNRFRSITLAAAIVLSIIFIWTIYAMVMLIKQSWAELKS